MVVKLFALFILFINFAVLSATPLDPAQIQAKIDWLHQSLNKKYWRKDQNYVFPILWQHQKGLFQSRVHFNIVDKRNNDLTAFIRDDFFKIDDINMFVTSFILYGLLEAQYLGSIKLDDHMVSLSLQAISNFRDKNSPKGVPQYAFWPQINVNGTWTAEATNLVHSINIIPQPNKFQKKILDKVGLSILSTARDLAKSFCIPADNDDSSVNLALLGLLKQIKSPHYEFWNSLHSRKQEYYERALKYAYRPFGANLTLNKFADQIDPRTYFVLRQFLDEKKKSSQSPSLILPTTWLINTEEQVKDLLVMPFRSNNVDASVCANFLFGLSYQLIQGQVQLTSDLISMMRDTTQLLEYTVTKILSKRPTLMLVYYPSKYDFYWFIARLLGLLKRQQQMVHPLPQIKGRLEKLMKQVSTKHIIDGAIQNQDGYHWREFLGNYAKKFRQQDSIFSSALALNALFDTWTTRVGKKLIFDPDITSDVKRTIQEGVKHLLSRLKPKMKALNAFFSGSMKIFDNSFPYFFPSNYAVDGKGNLIDPTNMTLKNLTFSTNVFMKGYVQAAKYEQMLKKNWFSKPVPIEEVDFNSQRGLTFPFWSSRAITEVMGISVLSKYLKVNEQVAGELRRNENI